MSDPILSWDHVASAFGAITMLLLAYMIRRQGVVSDKIDTHIERSARELNDKVSYPKCKEFRDECERLKHHAVECDISSTKRRVEQVQENLDYHTHTGLPPDSVAIKRRNNHG